MGVFDFLKKQNSHIGGEIGYFGLAEWWMSEFCEVDRKFIVQKYQPMGAGERSIIEGNLSFSSQSALSFLTDLSCWFRKDDERAIAVRILRKAEEYVNENTDVLDIHFFYGHKVSTFYKDRDRVEGALSEAIAACNEQIKIAKRAKRAFLKEYKARPLPCHKGYEQLAIIYEKQKNYIRAIHISQHALSQGWSGDWDKRMQRCFAKQEKIIINEL